MDYALIGTISRLTNTTPNWDREVTRAVGAARACAIAALIRALGVYRAASEEELEAILDSLPLRPWMETSVTALAEHPNDPARSVAADS